MVKKALSFIVCRVFHGKVKYVSLHYLQDMRGIDMQTVLILSQ